MKQLVLNFWARSLPRFKLFFYKGNSSSNVFKVIWPTSQGLGSKDMNWDLLTLVSCSSWPQGPDNERQLPYSSVLRAVGTSPLHLSFKRYSPSLFCTIAYVQTEHIWAKSLFKGHFNKHDATLRHNVHAKKAAKYNQIKALFKPNVYRSPLYHSTKKILGGRYMVSSWSLYPLEYYLSKVFLIHPLK